MQTMKLISNSGSETTVEVVAQTEKAIKVRGNASEAWFPKAAIDREGRIARWFRMDMVHTFLFLAPKTQTSETA